MKRFNFNPICTNYLNYFQRYSDSTEIKLEDNGNIPAIDLDAANQNSATYIADQSQSRSVYTADQSQSRSYPIDQSQSRTHKIDQSQSRSHKTDQSQALQVYTSDQSQVINNAKQLIFEGDVVHESQLL